MLWQLWYTPMAHLWPVGEPMEQVEDEVDLPEEGPGGRHGRMTLKLLLVYPLVIHHSY